MTDELDWPPILAAIEQGIKSACQQRLDANQQPADDFTAFVILRELHREGWSVSKTTPS
jgi:hypothetical protein